MSTLFGQSSPVKKPSARAKTSGEMHGGGIDSKSESKRPTYNFITGTISKDGIKNLSRSIMALNFNLDKPESFKVPNISSQ